MDNKDMHYNPNHYLCGRLYGGGVNEMSKFSKTYLQPRAMPVDRDTREPLEKITLTMILDDDLLQFFSQEGILMKWHYIRIDPLYEFGYSQPRQVMSMKDVYDGLLACGFKTRRMEHLEYKGRTCRRCHRVHHPDMGCPRQGH